MKYLIDWCIIKPVFWILAILTLGWCYTPTNQKWYRKFKGGTWYGYYPRMYCYMTFYTQNRKSILSHEIIFSTEVY